MIWILDCSFTSALFLPDESSDKVNDFFRNFENEYSLIVPSLWWYELSNVLFVSIKRNRLVYNDALKIFDLFKEFKIETEKNINEKIAKSIFELSRQYKISAYDATYLELALRKNAGLASLDKELNKIADKCGLNIFNF
jgi:predicted nucleic acid-binding protein